VPVHPVVELHDVDVERPQGVRHRNAVMAVGTEVGEEAVAGARHRVTVDVERRCAREMSAVRGAGRRHGVRALREHAEVDGLPADDHVRREPPGRRAEVGDVDLDLAVGLGLDDEPQQVARPVGGALRAQVGGHVTSVIARGS
jgi:hypothetical protein